MTPPKGELNTELESFRQKWLSDLQTRDPQSSQPSQASQTTSQAGPSSPTKQRRTSHSTIPPLPLAPQSTRSVRRSYQVVQDEDLLASRVFDEPHVEGNTLTGGSKPVAEGKKELVSALDHFEEAMEKEAQGNMGDSLNLYRRAYRLDTTVDRRYREKHFPPNAPKPTPPTSTATQQAPDPTEPDPQPLSISELISSFSTLTIPPLPAPIENCPPPPCPIAQLPEELLSHILQDVAIADVADFARLSLVCKKLAHLVATEQRIWKRVVVGTDFGFPSMLYQFERGILWEDLPEEEDEISSEGEVTTAATLQAQRRALQEAYTLSLTPSLHTTWQSHFRFRPRLRFNGAYISTVNYIRQGQASTNQTTWGGPPIHIVTYYRYLRFFRDGSCLSLLTTSEPGDVVHHLTKHNLLYHREQKERSHASTLPSAVMHRALKGRWKLGDPTDGAEEADISVETEGVGSKYMYRMDLSMRSAGKGAKNNKVVWQGFYSHNKLTDDWAEFGLKNDKPFFFSRVKSYGLGG